jgi:uncharacterized membrane protein
MRPKRAAGRRVAFAGACGLAAGLASAAFVPWQAGELIGWDVAAAMYLLRVWLRVAPLDADGTEKHARSEDPSVPVADIVIVSAGVACIAGSGLALTLAGRSAGGTKAYLIALAIASVVVSWACVHSVFTFRYARLYYAGKHGGIDFNSDDRPTFVDFAYVAFTIGMTFQVSDTDLTTSNVRHLALRHALLSYLFGAVIIGLTINVVASLLK